MREPWRPRWNSPSEQAIWQIIREQRNPKPISTAPSQKATIELDVLVRSNPPCHRLFAALAEIDNFNPVPGTYVRLGKYPVTVQEYRRFVDARGYEERKYWSAEGWDLKNHEQWVEPKHWERQLQTGNRPVVGVSWHEARAWS